MMKHSIKEKLKEKPFFSLKDFVGLVTNPTFLFITIVGNACILVFGTLLFLVEREINSTIGTWFDAIYWAFATVTTVGYGDVVAQTYLGKVISIVLMILGIGTFWGYTGLFASILIRKHILHSALKEQQGSKKED